MLQGTFTVSWVGMDCFDYEQDFSTLEQAESSALSCSESGGHCIFITDVDGVTYGF